MKLFNKKSCLAFVIIVALAGCNKQLDVEVSTAAPKNEVWKTYDDARAGLVAIYGLTRAAMADNNAHWMYGELRLGDFESTKPGDYIDAIVKNQLHKGFPEIKQLTNWRRFYAAIDAANIFIENSANCKQDLRYSDLNNKVDIAQAHVLRAFLYFYISRIWGDVPLITKSSTQSKNTQVARTPQNQVLDFCINELYTYKDSLPTEYGGDDKSKLNYDGNYYGENWSVWGNSFWGYYQCAAILAHIFAWKGDYKNCLVWCSTVINNAASARLAPVQLWQVSTYMSGPASIFYSNGVKGGTCYQLLSLPYNMPNRESGPSAVGHFESLSLANPYLTRPKPNIYIPRKTIDALFYSTTDYRHPYQSDYKNYGETYFKDYYDATPMFVKFRTNVGSDNLPIFGSCIPLSRWEDIRLLQAECFMMLNDFNNAWLTLNDIREKRFTNGFWGSTYPNGVRMPPTLKSMEGGLLYNILRERKLEFWGEGTQWYDMIRYKKNMRDDAVFNKLFEQGGIYWPIDQDIIDRNPKIEQNSYWKK